MHTFFKNASTQCMQNQTNLSSSIIEIGTIDIIAVISSATSCHEVAAITELITVIIEINKSH